jgi:DNA 3'-phosphatase
MQKKIKFIFLQQLNKRYIFRDEKKNYMAYEIIKTDNFSPLKGEGVFFDLDWTLIKPAGKYKFYNSRNNYDWVWAFPTVKEIIKNFDTSGLVVYIITNQLKYDHIVEERIRKVIKELDIECCALIATGHGCFRKPGTSLLSLLDNKIIKGRHSFYCGDAAGRPNDHSDDDLYFAFHTKLPFLTPEKVFNEKIFIGSFIVYPPMKTDLEMEKKLRQIYLDYDGVFLIGLPGAGKTYLRNWFLETFGKKEISYINHDEKKSVLDGTKRFLIIDNTNLTEKSRQEIEHNWKEKRFAIIFLDIPLKESVRGVKYRSSIMGGSHVADIALRSLVKKLEPPISPTLHLKKRPILNKSFPHYLADTLNI